MCCFSPVIPNISLLDYLNRLFEYSKCDESTIILTLIFIDRACSNGIFLSQYVIYRLISAGLLLSIKYNEDNYKDYCKIEKCIKGFNINGLDYDSFEDSIWNPINTFIQTYKNFEKVVNLSIILIKLEDVSFLNMH